MASYDVFVAAHWRFPIYFHTNGQNTKIVIISWKIIRLTSYLDTNIISIRETFCESLVKIWGCDVTWRHMTFFANFDKNVPKKCWRKQKMGCIWLMKYCFSITALYYLSNEGSSIFNRLMVQKLQPDEKKQRIDLKNADVITKKCWRQQNNDVTLVFFIFSESSKAALLSCKVSSL